MKRDDAEDAARAYATRKLRELKANGTPAPTAERKAFALAHESFSHNLTKVACRRIKRHLRALRTA